MKALAFDLGDTLVEYEGLPLSWEEHYPEALARLGSFLGISPGLAQIEAASAVLRNYNTRIRPREIEVGFCEILKELLCVFQCHIEPDELRCAEAFFSVFRQRLRCFPDTVSCLSMARSRGQTIGVFTDVPYGMPRELVLNDMNVAGIADLVDVLLTSREAGFRKPSRRTLEALSLRLGCTAKEMIYVGNERKDVEAALAFGCEAVLLDRCRRGDDWGQHRTIVSLSRLGKVF
jgi:putative hydrolase of the HAD superfamily